MVLADRFSQLFRHLGQLPPDAPVHLQHLVIRVQRAKNQAQQGQGVEGLELLVRLRGRLEELAEGLDELLQGEENDQSRSQWLQLKGEAEKARRDLDRELRKVDSTASTRPQDTIPPAIDPTRRAITRTELDRANFEAFVARMSETKTLKDSQRASLSSLAQRRAKALSTAHSLFLLATSPSTVLPSGQTLSSIFRGRNHAPNPPSRPIDKVSSRLSEGTMGDLEAKLSPYSAIDGSREEAWTMICRILRGACLPLVPERLGNGSVRREVQNLLEGPTSTTTTGESGVSGFDWETVFGKLQTLVGVLRKLCAPVRDPTVAQLLEALKVRDGNAAKGLVAVVASILALAETMQADVESFGKGFKVESMTETDLVEAVRDEARERERKAVRQLLHDETDSDIASIDGEIRLRTTTWVQCNSKIRDKLRDRPSECGSVTREQVAATLVDSLFSEKAISIPPLAPRETTSATAVSSPDDSNPLPPIFYSTSPRLFELQNQFQALAIVACLSSVLVPSTPPITPVPTVSEKPSVVSRLWTIVNSEAASSSSPHSSPPPTPTRLAHLSDEIIAHLDDSDKDGQISPERKTMIRNSVDRILRYQDPVFKLLHGRLRQGVLESLLTALQLQRERRGAATTGAGGGSSDSRQVPTSLRTGRALIPTATSSTTKKRPPSLYTSEHDGSHKDRFELSMSRSIKGYEKLDREVLEIMADKFGPTWEWMEHVWSDVLGWS
ncbi:hypothetical protein JCM3766R1_005587 [Sporobolomyces carnicolor]